MSPLAEFSRRLLHEGQALFQRPPLPTQGPDADSVDVLGKAFALYRLGVAGPSIEFDAPTALAAAALVQHACWFAVSHAEPPRELARLLTMPGPPQAPAEHLSADLTLRLLPQVHLRARARKPDDPLVELLSGILRQWPLSGVLSAVEEGPLTPLDFAGHHGLLLLYAERWSQREKPAWLPDGRGLEYVELVRGRMVEGDADE